jgi:cytochrome c oxidase subunit 4
MTDVVEPGSEVVSADEGGAAVPFEAEAPVVVEGHVHPGPRTYVIIAIVLVILTGIEVATSYLEGDVNSNLLIVVLAVMAATKFFLVCAWYMHMKMDPPFFRNLFVIGLIGATVVYGVVMLMFASTVLLS